MKKIFYKILMFSMPILTIIPLLSFGITGKENNQTNTADNTETIENSIVSQNGFDWNDTNRETKQFNLQYNTYAGKTTVFYDILIPESMNIYDFSSDNLTWSMSFSHNMLAFGIKNPLCDIKALPNETKEPSTLRNLSSSNDTIINATIEHWKGNIFWCTALDKTIRDIKVSVVKHNSNLLNVKFDLIHRHSRQLLNSDLRMLRFHDENLAINTNPKISITTDFTYKNVDLNRVDFNQNNKNKQIEEHFISLNQNFLKLGTTYFDIQEDIKKSIDTSFSMDWNYVDLYFYDENNNLIDKSSVIQNPNLKMKVKSNTPGKEDYWFGETSYFQILIPYINFELNPTEDLNRYGHSNSNNSIWQNQNGWIQKGDETDLIYRTNSDSYFTLNDPNVSYATIDIPGTNDQYIVSNGQTHLINYNIEQFSRQDYENKITFYLNDGNKLDFIYNVKQRSTPVTLKRGSTKYDSNVYLYNNQSEDANTFNFFPLIEIDRNLIKQTHITNPSGIKYQLNESLSILRDDGFGVYKIETLDWFGNTNIQYVEVYQQTRTYIKELYEISAPGFNFYNEAMSVGYSRRELNNLQNQDIYKVKKELSNIFDLSTISISFAPILDWIRTLSHGVLLSQVKGEIDNYIYQTLDANKNTNWSIKDYVVIKYYDMSFKELSLNDSIPRYLRIKISTAENQIITEDGHDRFYSSKVKNHYISQELEVYEYSPLNIRNIQLSQFEISSSLGQYDIEGKIFGDIQNTLNQEVLKQINKNNTTNNLEYLEEDFQFSWVGKLKGKPQREELLYSTDLETLISNTFTLNLYSRNDKSIENKSLDINFNFYQSTDISQSNLDFITNEIIPIYINTEFWRVKQWLDNEILYLLNESLYNFEKFKEPLKQSDLTITYSISDDYLLKERNEVFTYSLKGNNKHYHGEKTGTVSFELKPKINEINNLNFDNEVLMKRNERKIKNLESHTNLWHIKKALEEEIALQIYYDNFFNSTFSLEEFKIEREDLNYDYSIKDDQKIWNEFNVNVLYAFSEEAEQEPLSITINFNKKIDVLKIVNISLLLILILIFSALIIRSLKRRKEKIAQLVLNNK